MNHSLRDLVIGLDCSTTACKAIAWDRFGNSHAEGRAALSMSMPASGFHEQSAQMWWQSTCQAIQQVTSQIDPARLAAVCVAHQRESFVPLDQNNQPLRPAILWMDERSRPYLDELGSSLGQEDYHQRTGKPLSGNLAVGKIAWLRQHEPAIFERTALYLDTHAYIMLHLVGKPITSWASADPLGLLDMRWPTPNWDEHTLSVLGITPQQLPSLAPPGGTLGTVTQLASQESGLPQGLPVVAGLGDGQAGALGVNLQPSEASLSLGTSVVSGTISDRYVVDRAYRTTTSGIPGYYLLETVLLGGAYTLRWFLETIASGPDNIGSLPSEEAFEQLAAQVPPGANGLILVPYWNSAMNPYWDAGASGIIAGWRGTHRKEHIYRAILEGIAFETLLHIEGMEASLSAPIQRLVAVGGGARSDLWCQILADITARPLYRSASHEAAALGAGILAATAAGWYSDVPQAARAMTRLQPGSFSPDPQQHGIYSRLYQQVYRHLFPALQIYLDRLTALTTLD
jgi:sugar (pentulose or hexulose) kinase